VKIVDEILVAFGVFGGMCAAWSQPRSFAALQRGFENSPDDARVMMRWWRLGPAVTNLELERELRATGACGSILRSAGQCCKFRNTTRVAQKTSSLGALGGHFAEFVDELILTPDTTSAQLPQLALPNYVYRLIALNRS